MGILRTAAVATIGVVAYRAWQRHKAGDWSTRAQPDHAGTTPPHGDELGDELSTAAAGNNVVGLGGTQSTDSGLGGSGSRAGQASPGFGS